MNSPTLPLLARFLMTIFIVVACVPAARGEMIYLSAQQTVSGSGTQLDPIEKSSDAILPFSDDLLHTSYVRDEDNAIVGNVTAFASLISNLTPSRVAGLGRGSGFASGPAEGLGAVDMVIEFRVDEPMNYTMAGQLRLAPHTLGLNGSAARVALNGPDGTVFEIRLDEENPPDELGMVNFLGADRITGRLPVGVYTLAAVTEGHGSDGLERCVDFEFTFGEAIPEPAGFSLAMIALFAAGFCRRGLKRS